MFCLFCKIVRFCKTGGSGGGSGGGSAFFWVVLVGFACLFCLFVGSVGSGGGGIFENLQTGALLPLLPPRKICQLGILLFLIKCLTGISPMCYYINNETEKGERICE